MNLETRAREAATTLLNSTAVDPDDGLRQLHRTHRRRTTGKAVAAVALVAVGAGVAQAQLGGDRAAGPVRPSDQAAKRASSSPRVRSSC